MKYSPTRILGALRRRGLDVFRGVIYRYFSLRPLQESALFESFQGKIVGDNPLPIFEEIKSRNVDLKFFFTIQHGSLAPSGAEGLTHGSIAWLRALARSKLLVNNTNFPSFFRKRPGQVYLQTWHGTPLKRLGKDIFDAAPTTSYLKMMDREASYWDFLISPSRYCSELFPRTFGFSGEILETGYPRNDLLSTGKSKAGEIRATLGISDNRKVVLYAPTWRDYKRTATGNWRPVNFLEQGLGEQFVLLYRGHTNTHSAHNSKVAKGAIDVTRYRNVVELYLIADVLVTDYSSSMFDFSVSGKPMVFLTPDIDEYIAKRGFYFDFEATAPGPIIRDPNQLRASLENLESLSREYQARYRAWQEKFNSLEDGKAASRVVDRVLTAFHS